MFRSSKRLSSRAFIALTLSGATLSAAGAATFHRLAVGQTTGSNGSTTFLQSGTGSALQGEVAPSANTGITTKFGVLGEFNPSGSTFGVGTIGISTTGYAVAGESLSDTQPSILAYPGGKGIGLEATTQSTSSSPAIFAASKGTGDGVQATSVNKGGPAAVEGDDLATPDPSTLPHEEAGVLGTSQIAPGVLGVGSTGVSGSGTTLGVSGTTNGTGPGVQGSNTSTNSGGIGVEATSESGDAFSGTAGGGSAASLANDSDGAPTLLITAGGTAPVITATGTNGSLNLDEHGNLLITGTLEAAGSSARTRNPNSDLMSYGDEVTEPTMEDVGSANLVNGSATVPLAADYRQTIEGANYMVFLTPYGENNGLFIASRTAAGFVVRESHGGRSSLAFDYRIVAQQYGMHGGRLPHYTTLDPSGKNQRLTDILRSDALQRYKATREALAETRKEDASMRASLQTHMIPRPLPASPLGVSVARH
jgi:hypothetical protein